MTLPLRNLLIVDVETTGIDFEENAPIEIGAILFDVGHRAVTHQFSALLPSVVPNGAEAVNGIPDSLLASGPVEQLSDWAISYLQSLYDLCDAVIAHNVDFDRLWLEPLLNCKSPTPWICTLRDFRWHRPGLRATPSVIDLALAHGVPVWAAHRALTDCDYLVHVFQRCAQLEALLVAAQEPRELYRARLSYAERHQAREAGFRWNDPVTGAWSRRLSQNELESLPFAVVRVDQDLPVPTFPQSA